MSFLLRNVNDFIPKVEYNKNMEKFAERLKLYGILLAF